MKYEDFKDWIQQTCMHETLYDDSEGRTILVITELDAWAMCNKFAEVEREALEVELLKLKQGVASKSDYIQGRWDLIGEFQDIIRARSKT
jgi:hypothetical protein